MMGPLAFSLAGLALWLIWTGRLKRMTGLDGAMLGIALVGSFIAAKGRLIIGIPMLLIAARHFFRRKPSIRDGGDSPRRVPIRLEAERTDVADARALLGLPLDFKEADVQDAYRRLMTRVHPDAGGTDALAQKINDARALLLRHHFERKRS